jgi:S1-C subfamily serine protease
MEGPSRHLRSSSRAQVAAHHGADRPDRGLDLGLQARPLSANPGSTSGSTGVQVTAVVVGGPADAAGIRAGDVITSINGRPARSTTVTGIAWARARESQLVKLAS